MSIQYCHYLSPENIRYLPSPEQVATLVEGLVDEGWVDGTQLAYRAHAYAARSLRNFLRVGHVAEDLAALWQDAAGVLVQLPVVEAAVIPGDRRPFGEMPPGTPLGVRQCQGLDLLASKALSLIPGGEAGSRLPCASCGDDLLGQLEDPPPTEWSTIAPEIEGRLAGCGRCGVAPDFERLNGQARRASDGTLVEEPSPFFRFAVCLTSDSPPDQDRAATDPALAAILQRSMGESFRAFPRWG
jgi:hypothetical protein